MRWTRIAAAVLALAPAAVPDPAAAAAATCTNTMAVVAHEDDDLLFVNPEISDDIVGGRCVTTLYVTSGDAARGRDYWRGREEGEMAAYARMAARPSRWTEDTLIISGHPIHRSRLDGVPVTLLFLRLPDRVGGWPDQTLQLLWLDPLTRIPTLDDGPAYTRTSLLAVLGSVLAGYRPRIIRTLDFRGAYGDGDHDDHHTVAYFVWAAQQHYRTPHRTVGHLGYPISREPANLNATQYGTKLGYFLTYAPHDRVVCQTADWCTRGTYGVYVRRNVPVGPPIGPGRNVAAQARITASSANAATVQLAAKAVDGRLGTGLIGEWVTAGETIGAWLDLRWPTPQRLGQIALYDRPGAASQVTAGLLHFSDGSTIPVGALPDDGSPLILTFAPRTVSGLRLTVTGVSAATTDVGLAEIRTITAP
ncbi:DUF7402 domain-containing protein [Actinoplanes sp. HUAS TT8]|uniref:DUF7402 domain-containing protein n=1 Tax=Actinoplanes sp. HUAS TT8 TaxID=3447453 RepID=UPI003F51AD78